MDQGVAKTVILVVDSLGVGALPDSFDYGDHGVNCLTHVSEAIEGLSLPYSSSMGFGNITYIKNCARLHETEAFYGKIKPRSAGKEKLLAYWEMVGIITDIIPTVYTNAIPEEVLHQFSQIADQRFIGGRFASSISELTFEFEEHLKTKKPIIYPASDGAVHMMAHEDIVSPRELYQLCFKLRRLCDRHKIMRLIANPCSGEREPQALPDKDKVFAMPSPHPGVIGALSIRDIDIYSVGKVSDYFNDLGFSETYRTNNHLESLEKAVSLLTDRSHDGDQRELIFVEYGYDHSGADTKTDPVTSYAAFLEGIESYIPVFKKNMNPEDILIILGDQPNDPTQEDKIFTREYVPIIFFSKLFKPYDQGSLGIRATLSDLAITLAEMYGFEMPFSEGESFWGKVSAQL